MCVFRPLDVRFQVFLRYFFLSLAIISDFEIRLDFVITNQSDVLQDKAVFLPTLLVSPSISTYLLVKIKYMILQIYNLSFTRYTGVNNNAW